MHIRAATITTLLTLLGVTACEAPQSSESVEIDEGEFRAVSAEDWPIVLDGVPNASQIENYTYLLDGKRHKIVDFADVVAKHPVGTISPYDTGTDPDLDTFKFDDFEAMVNAASDEGLEIIVPLEHWINPVPSGGVPQAQNAQDCANATAPGDTQWVGWQHPDPMIGWECHLYNEAGDVRLPLAMSDISKPEIGPDFIDWWGPKAQTFIDEIDNMAKSDAVWGFRGMDEPQPYAKWHAVLLREMRAQVDAEGGGRFLTGYHAGNRLPNERTIQLFVEEPFSDQTPYSPTSVQVDEPAGSVWHQDINDVSVPIDYTTEMDDVDVNREVTGAVRGLYTHYVRGNYSSDIGSTFGDNAILSYHRLLLARETLNNVETVYDEIVSQPGPDHKLFQVPAVLANLWEASLSDAEYSRLARHEMALAFHDSDGLWIWRFELSGSEFGKVWEWTVRAGLLIKGGLRDYLVNGAKSTPGIESITATTTEIEGEYYLSLGDDRHHYAMPDAAGKKYSPFHTTQYRLNDTVYLVVTSSFDQDLDFELEPYDDMCIDDVVLEYGEGDSDLSWSGKTFEDTVYGIDGRVYRVELKAC